MKKPTRIIIDDAEPGLDAAMLQRVQAIVEAATVTFQLKQDWRPAAEKSLEAILPGRWVYRGGRHMAVHAFPPRPREDKLGNIIPGSKAAGRRLFIIREEPQ